MPTEESGVAAATELLARDSLPTAVLAHNDRIAFGLLLTLRQTGVDVPGRHLVVGYDDTRLAALRGISLTSVSQDVRRLRAGSDHPRDRPGRGSRGPAEEFVTAPRLVVRDTSGPPRG